MPHASPGSSGQRRRVIELPNVAHAAPIPTAVLVDRVLASSAMFGADQRTGTVPDDAGAEVRCLFENISTVLELAGGSSADVVRMGVIVRESADRALVNEEWLAMFPDENDRPARHITVVPNLPARVQIEFLAVLSDEES